MFDWLNFHVDGISFVLGLATGTLFWIIWGQFKRHQPEIQANLKRAFKEFQKRHFSGVEVAIRQDALRRAQRSHIAASLFPLDEILVPPKCLMPLPVAEPGPEEGHNIESKSIFPYMLDWPELPSQFGSEFINLPAALQNHANIALVGQVGSGKTVALAYLATLMARKDPNLGNLQDSVPIFLHILDLLPLSTAETGGPTAALIRTITSRLPILDQNRAPSFLKETLAEGKALLLLDGLDELAPVELNAAVSLIASLQSEQSNLQTIITASPMFLDGIIRLGFQPLALACWNRSDTESIIHTWTESWNEHIATEIKRKSGMESIDPVFLRNWIRSEPIQQTPLELTLILWAACAGDGGPNSPVLALDTYILRLLSNSSLLPPVSKLALEMLKSQKTSFNQSALDELFSRVSLSQIQLFDPSENQVESKTGQKTKKQSKETASLSMQWVAALVEVGLFSEHAGHVLRFNHPATLAYLAAQTPIDDAENWLVEKHCWELRMLALGYSSIKNPTELVVPQEWMMGIAPLFRNLINSARILKYLPSSNPLRPRLLRRMAEGIMDANAIPAVKARFASALVCVNDPSVITLFRQMLTSPHATIRAVACLAIGALRDEKSLEPLTALLDDPDEEVRRNACFALGELPDKTAMEILIDCLPADDEIIRKASAETLASNTSRGHPILKEAIKSENLLTRRSVVFGLVRIHEPWARELLSQVAVQDGQWVVRNAASQALDGLDKPDSRVPRKLTPPSQTPWLFDYASKIGKGIPTDDLAVDILLHALSSGKTDEQIAALEYLRTYSDEKVQKELSATAMKAPPPVDNAAQFALWINESSHLEQAKVSRVALV